MADWSSQADWSSEADWSSIGADYRPFAWLLDLRAGEYVDQDDPDYPFAWSRAFLSVSSLREVGSTFSELAGTPAGVATVTGALTKIVELSGTITGSAAVQDVQSVNELSGTSAGTSIVLDVQTSNHLEATSDGATTVTADLFQVNQLVSSSAGVASVTASLTSANFIELAGSIAGTSTVLDVQVSNYLAGASDGATTVTGALSQTHSLTASSAGSATVNGSLGNVFTGAIGFDIPYPLGYGGASVQKLEGTSTNGSSAVTGWLQVERNLEGRSDGVTYSRLDPITVVNTSTVVTVASGNLTPTLPSGIQEGDLLVVQIVYRFVDAALTLTQGYQLREEYTVDAAGGNDTTIEYWWKIAGPSEVAPTISSLPFYGGAHMFAIRNVRQWNPWDDLAIPTIYPGSNVGTTVTADVSDFSMPIALMATNDDAGGAPVMSSNPEGFSVEYSYVVNLAADWGAGWASLLMSDNGGTIQYPSWSGGGTQHLKIADSVASPAEPAYTQLDLFGTPNIQLDAITGSSTVTGILQVLVDDGGGVLVNELVATGINGTSTVVHAGFIASGGTTLPTVPEHGDEYLYQQVNVGFGFEDIDDASGRSGFVSQNYPDGHTELDFDRYLYQHINVGFGFEDIDDAVLLPGFVSQSYPDGHTELDFDRYLYQQIQVIKGIGGQEGRLTVLPGKSDTESYVPSPEPPSGVFS